MKRLIRLTGLIAIALAIMFAFAACDEGGTNYGGTFDEISVSADKEQIMTDVETALNGMEANWGGVKMTFTMKGEESTPYGSVSMDAKGTAYMLLDETNPQMSLSLKMTEKMMGTKVTVQMDIYLKDGNTYMSTKGGGESVQYKISGGGMDGTEMMGGPADEFSLKTLFETFGELSDSSAVKVYVTASEGVRRIKIADETTTLIISVGKDNKVVGFKLTTVTNGMDMTMTFEPWTGTIKFPNGMENWADFTGYGGGSDSGEIDW